MGSRIVRNPCSYSLIPLPLVFTWAQRIPEALLSLMLKPPGNSPNIVRSAPVATAIGAFRLCCNVQLLVSHGVEWKTGVAVERDQWPLTFVLSV